ncbi:MAG TPA: 50S ribosomal protein L3 [Candidatus Hydrogenedens sp.]|nr:50S ribosomal protein L3 [Candidatus Hydrogenedens sp.]HOK10193.1 50S ribosomal protein L3 [Candidatus Hydrogenedens sp.]HOL20940.1 50S ribosomal protein L3 [Candidatus Hydrogenedens sp.]HPP59741.1 50S ribosomal protein L3 [Candidatus Hydrogenedens sp.]
MATGILGKKLGMTRIFTQDGQWIEVTLVQAGPCVVIQRKTKDKDGYEAVQLGFEDIKPKRCTKPLKGHFEKFGVNPKRFLKELRVEPDSPLKPGDEVKLDIFKIGDRVDVSGKSKGRGFAGVVKRFGYSGGPGTHGSNFHRRPGSIGQSAYPAEVYKGKGLPGHMGNVRVTVQNLEIVDIVPEKNLLVVRGAIPGANGELVEIKHTVKIKRKS